MEMPFVTKSLYSCFIENKLNTTLKSDLHTGGQPNLYNNSFYGNLKNSTDKPEIRPTYENPSIQTKPHQHPLATLGTRPTTKKPFNQKDPNQQPITSFGDGNQTNVQNSNNLVPITTASDLMKPANRRPTSQSHPITATADVVTRSDLSKGPHYGRFNKV